MPGLAALYGKHKEEGLVVLLVNSTASAEAVRRHAKENGIPPELFVLTQPGAGEPEELYRVDDLPTAYVIGRGGRILAAAAGFVGEQVVDGERKNVFIARTKDGAIETREELPFADAVRMAVALKGKPVR